MTSMTPLPPLPPLPPLTFMTPYDPFDFYDPFDPFDSYDQFDPFDYYDPSRFSFFIFHFPFPPPALIRHNAFAAPCAVNQGCRNCPFMVLTTGILLTGTILQN